MPAMNASAMTMATSRPWLVSGRAPVGAAVRSYVSVTVQDLRQDLRDLHPASLPRRDNAGAHHRKRSRRVLAPDFVPTLSANSRGKLLEFLDQGVIRCALDRCGLAFAALEKTEPVVQIVVGGGVLAVDVHQIILGRRGVAGVQRRQRAVVVLEDKARHI